MLAVVATAVTLVVAVTAVVGARIAFRDADPPGGVGAIAAGAPGQADSPSPSVTQSPLATDPVAFDPADGPPRRPEALRTADTAGAEAAAQYFVELVAEGFVSGDIGRLADLSDSKCDYCWQELLAITGDALEAAETGQLPEDGTVTFTRVEGSEEKPGTSWTVDMEFDTALGSIVEAGETAHVKLKGSRTVHMDIGVTHDGERWLIREVRPEVVPRSDD